MKLKKCFGGFFPEEKLFESFECLKKQKQKKNNQKTSFAVSTQ